MAKDDYFVLVYKILEHLYACLKDENREVNYRELQPHTRSFPISESYWSYIWATLQEEGLIEGVASAAILGTNKKAVRFTPYLQITPKGIAYLQENNMMAKAKSFITTAADLVPRFF